MHDTVLFNLSAIVAMIPASLLAMRRGTARDTVFWMVLGVAVTGPLVWVLSKIAGAWQTDISTALWTTIAASMVIFAAIAAVTRHGWQLTPLISTYMVILGIVAAIWVQAPAKPLAAGEIGNWFAIQIAVSIATYGLVTIAAVTALAAVLQERAVKGKRPTPATRMLPSVADCDQLMVRLLIISEIVLSVGLATGMALQYGDSGRLLVLDHKTILTATAFVVIGALLVAHYRTGLRGRKAARFVLLAYLLLTLGYPGVKFVTDVLLA